MLAMPATPPQAMRCTGILVFCASAATLALEQTTTSTTTTDICHCTTSTTTRETTTTRLSSTSTTTTDNITTTVTSTSGPSTTTTSMLTSTSTTTTTSTSTNTTTSTSTTSTSTVTTSSASSQTTSTSTSTTSTTTSTTTTSTGTTTCPPCGDYRPEPVIQPSAPRPGLVCGSNCADLSWDFASYTFGFGVFFWIGQLGCGVSLTFYACTSSVDETKEQLEVMRSRLQSSLTYSILHMALASAQCVFFAMRTFSKSVSLPMYLVELVATVLFALNLFLGWVCGYLKSLSEGFVHTFTWGVVDAMLLPSVLCLFLIEVDGAKSWFSLSFVASVHIFESWRWLVEIKRLDLRVLKWQALDVFIPFLVFVYFSAMMMMSLENLGDPDWLKDLNEDKWTVISSLYFVFVTLSTVGYGDVVPVTSLGRLFAVAVIFGGISAFMNAMNNVMEVMNLHNSGGGHFQPRIRVRHIVVTGNPTVNMALDFIAELFHPDHAEDAEDLHLVMMLPRGSLVSGAVNKFLRQRQNLNIAPRVHVLQGSVLHRDDLVRCCPLQASAFFVLPNIQCHDVMSEDTENIIRMMAVLKTAPKVRLILLLMKAEHEQMLHDTGVGHVNSNMTCLALDQFKLELVGKSCLVPGFATMMCNLFKTIADADEDPILEATPGMSWLGSYDMGCGNELYEVELSPTYSSRGAVFSEVVLDVLEQTDGKVYLIGLVEIGLGQKRVLVNPGTFYPIKAPHKGVQTSGIFIAADRDCVIQCDQGVFLGRRERPENLLKSMEESEALVPRKEEQDPSTKDATGAQPNQEQKPNAGREIVPATANALHPNAPPVSPPKPPTPALKGAKAKADANEQKKRDAANAKRALAESQKAAEKSLHDLRAAKQILMLAEQQRKALQPHRPPMKLLAKGGHVLFLCVGAHAGDELRLGVEHFLKPMRGAYAGTEIPLVVMAPVPPRDWHRVSEANHVYYLKGSPLSIFDLQRANFRACSVIFVCHVGSPRGQLLEQWQVDSEVVCCLRLIESEIPWGSDMSIIAEVIVPTNHSFVALPMQAPGRGDARSSLNENVELMGRNQSKDSTLRLSAIQKKLSLESLSIKSHHNAVVSLPEYYRQPRFACGQLFVGNVVTSLVVNSFYNPSLWELIHTMIASQVFMVPVKDEWEGKSYYEFFDYMLRQEELMPVAMYRVAEAPKATLGAKPPRIWSYVFTAPPAKETHMMKGDSMICFGVSASGISARMLAAGGGL